MNTKIVSKNPASANQIETFTLVWSDIAILIQWEPYYHGDFLAHLQITSENRLELPITNTGYLSHFVAREVVAEYG